MARMGGKRRRHIPGSQPGTQAIAGDAAARGRQAAGNSRPRPHPAGPFSGSICRKGVTRRDLTKYVALAAVLAFASGAAAESLVDTLLRVSGLTASPAQMRAPGDPVGAGNIWIASLDRPAARAVTTRGRYRSP